MHAVKVTPGLAACAYATGQTPRPAFGPVPQTIRRGDDYQQGRALD